MEGGAVVPPGYATVWYHMFWMISSSSITFQSKSTYFRFDSEYFGF